MPYEVDLVNVAFDRCGGFYGVSVGVMYWDGLCRSLFTVVRDEGEWFIEVFWIRILPR